jgi:ABC-2 type transport system permease protein
MTTMKDAAVAVPAPVLQDELRSAIATHAKPSPPSALSATLTHFWRAVATFRHHPSQLIDMVLFPFIFLLVFTYLFGGAIGGSTRQYLQAFLPGIMVQAVVLMSVYTGTSLNTDITRGIFDRFRTLPFWQPAAIVGSLMADVCRYLGALTLTVVLGLVLGFRPASVLGTLLAMLVLVFFAFGVSWAFTALGAVAKTPETISSLSMIVVFPLLFASNIFVPTETMPRWMQIIADGNPVSLAATAARGLAHGTVTGAQMAWVLGVTVGFIAVFGPLTMWAYRNRTAK